MIGGAAGGEFAVVQFDYFFGKGQAEAIAFLVAFCSGGIGAVKSIKNMRQRLFLDAEAAIRDLKTGVVVTTRQVDRYQRIIRGCI